MLLETAAYMLGEAPERADALAVDSSRTPESLEAAARERLASLDDGSGVVVLTDLVGATPANVATRLSDAERVRVLCGVNLSMLIKALNYRHLPLEQLAEKALKGAHDGILSLDGHPGRDGGGQG